MWRWWEPVAVGVIASVPLMFGGVLLLRMNVWAQSAPTGTQFPAALDDNTTLPAVTAGDVITSAAANVQSSAIRALEVALGADATWPTNTVKQRLAAVPALGGSNVWTGINSFKSLNSVLNAGRYTGADIGAQVNAAVADCDTNVGGSTGFCRITIPPGYWTQSTAIKVSRTNTELDCQGAWLVTASGFQDAPIRVNLDDAYIGDGGALTHPKSNIWVRNCNIANGAQTTKTVFYSGGSVIDSRSARVVAFEVTGLVLDNLYVRDSFGPGIQALASTGIVRGLQVESTRHSYTGDPASGVELQGAGFGAGQAGTMLVADGITVAASDAVGVRLITGAEASHVNVLAANGPCVSIGGPATQGWATLSDFVLSDCAQSVSMATGAIDDGLANGSNPLQHVIIRNGTIRRTHGDGVRLMHAVAELALEIDQVSVECFGTTAADARGIIVSPGGPNSYATIRRSRIGAGAGCSASNPGTPAGIDIETPADAVTVDGNHITQIGIGLGAGYGILISGQGPAQPTRLAITNNVIREIRSAGIYAALNSGATDLLISGNTFSACEGSGTCGAILLAAPGASSWVNLWITGNRSETNSVNPFGILTNLGGTATTQAAVYSNNFFPDSTGSLTAHQILQGGSGTIAFQTSPQ